MEVDSLYCGPKRKNGCQRKINGSRLSLLWAKKKKWVLGKNKWESTPNLIRRIHSGTPYFFEGQRFGCQIPGAKKGHGKISMVLTKKLQL